VGTAGHDGPRSTARQPAGPRVGRTAPRPATVAPGPDRRLIWSVAGGGLDLARRDPPWRRMDSPPGATMTRGRNGASAGAIGALFLLSAGASAQQDILRADPCSRANVVYTTPLAAVVGCGASGYAPDQFQVGLMYAHGIELPRNQVEAARWFRMAAEQGHAAAQHQLGVMYTEGEGVPEDDAEAVRWYRLAAEQGYVPAQGNLGVMYDNGFGVPE